MIMVMTMNGTCRAGAIPDVNMWCTQTIKPRSAIATDEGPVLVDAGVFLLAGLVHGQVRSFCKRPLQTAIYTHGHVDHVFGVQAIKEKTGARTYIHHLDREQLERNPKVARQFGLDPAVLGTPVIDEELVEGKAVGWQDLAFDVIHTPGHTRGSVTFLLGEQLFGGDTLFRRSIGRSDLPGGDFEALMTSIQGKLYALPPETIVYPGHGPATTIGEEMRENPFVSVGGL